MALQTEYPNRRAKGYPGMLSDTGFFDNDSMTVETAAVAFGAPVAYGSGDRMCRPMAAGDTRIAGVAIRVQGLAATEAREDEFAVGDTASIMKKGRMFVTASVAVAAGDPVHVVLATGAWTNTGGLEVAGGVYQTGAAAGELARIRLT